MPPLSVPWRPRLVGSVAARRLPAPSCAAPAAGAAGAGAARPRSPRSGAGRDAQPSGRWVGIWEAPALSPALPALTMSICCCLFFRDYGSSKRKSGKAPGFFVYCMILERTLLPAFPLLSILCGIELCSSLTFYCWILLEISISFFPLHWIEEIHLI